MGAPRIGIFGASGSGKSTYARSMIKRLPKTARVMVFDPMNDYDGLGLETFEDLNLALAHVIANFKTFRFRYRPPDATPHALNLMAGLAHKIQEPYSDIPTAPQLWFFADELHLAYPLHGDNSAPYFKKLCTHGRHLNIALVGITQRIASIGITFRSQAEETTIFRLRGEADIKAAVELGFDKQEIKSLVNYQWIKEKFGDISRGEVKKIP